MTKYSKGKFRMNNAGLDLEAALSPWLRFCIGLAIVALAVTPLMHVIRWW